MIFDDEIHKGNTMNFKDKLTLLIIGFIVLSVVIIVVLGFMTKRIHKKALAEKEAEKSEDTQNNPDHIE